MENLEIKTGIIAGKGADTKGEDGVTNVEKAYWNEYGTDTGIPARPFMRRTADEKAKALQVVTSTALRSVVSGQEPPRNAMERIGMWFAAQIVRTIDRASSWAAPNAPSTIAAKGSSAPLRDTSQMRQAVSHVVQAKGADS